MKDDKELIESSIFESEVSSSFDFLMISLGNKATCSLPLIEEQLTEVQEALSKLASQVQNIQESLQAVRKTKPETGSNRNNSSVSEMSIIETETAT